MSDRAMNHDSRVMLAATTGVSTEVGPTDTTATPVWHCCGCYDKAMASDAREAAETARVNTFNMENEARVERINAALRILEIDTGKVSSDLKEQAEAYLNRTLGSASELRMPTL